MTNEVQALAPAAGSAGLTEWQQERLKSLRKGYGLSAARGQWKAEEWRQMQDLVSRGLVRKTAGTAWAPAGIFVLPPNAQGQPRGSVG